MFSNALRVEKSFENVTNFNEPFIVRNGCKHFPAYTKWDKKYISEHLSINTEIEYHVDKTNVGYCKTCNIDTMYNELSENEDLYIRNVKFHNTLLSKDVFGHYKNLLDQSIYLGNGSSHYHWHSSCKNVVLNQINGDKILYVISPIHYIPSLSYFNIGIQRASDTYQNILKSCKDLKCIVNEKEFIIEKVILKKGDSLFIPPFYWHNASGYNRSVSVVQEYSRKDFSFVKKDFRFFITCYLAPIYRYFIPKTEL